MMTERQKLIRTIFAFKSIMVALPFLFLVFGGAFVTSANSIGIWWYVIFLLILVCAWMCIVWFMARTAYREMHMERDR